MLFLFMDSLSNIEDRRFFNVCLLVGTKLGTLSVTLVLSSSTKTKEFSKCITEKLLK